MDCRFSSLRLIDRSMASIDCIWAFTFSVKGSKDTWTSSPSFKPSTEIVTEIDANSGSSVGIELGVASRL